MAGQWADVCSSPVAKHAFSVALAEYANGLNPDPVQPGAAAFKLQGAKEVLGVLMNLGVETAGVRKGEREKELVAL